MTCIIGAVSGDLMCFGADSAGIAGYSLAVRQDAKIFEKGEMLFGFTSSFRMGQLLRYKLALPEHPEGMEPYEYMVSHFIDAVRGCLKTGGYAKKSDESETGGTFLVGYRKRLFRIDSDYQVGENVAPYAALGCGEELALGALSMTDDLAWPLEHRVYRALEVAERWSAGVRRPFSIILKEYSKGGGADESADGCSTGA